jgi:glycosyltransferase involved in cell wall biosynthesis
VGRSTFEAVPGFVRIRKRPLTLARALAVSVLSGRPYSIVKYPKDVMLDAVRRYCSQSMPDLIITSLFTWHLTPVGPWKVLLDVHNVEHELWQSFEPLLPATKAAFVRREARLLQEAELAAWKGSNGIIAICEEDASKIRQASPCTPVRHVPVRIAPMNRALLSEGGPALFDLGMLAVWSWAPNGIAAKTFEKSIMPDLAKAGLRVVIAGTGLDPEVKSRLEHWGVECPGHIPDLGDFYRSVRLVAAPYTLGGGVRMKVAEALSWGKPVIGTALAFRGIGPGVPLGWIVRDIEAMTDALIHYMIDLPEVPSSLAAEHSLERQQQALQELIDISSTKLRKSSFPTPSRAV